MNISIQETQQTLGKIDSKRSRLKHIIIKQFKAKVKERILRAVREK